MTQITKNSMQLSIITPVHIGGADYKTKLNKIEFIYKKNQNKLIIIDSNKLINLLIKNNLLDKYIDYVQKNLQGDINEFLNNNNLSKEIYNIAKKTYSDIKLKKDNNIHLLINDSKGEPYIPGSSIKGSILNALIVDYIISHRDEFENIRKNLLKDARSPQAFVIKPQWKKRIEDKELIKMILGEGEVNYGLSVSDTYKNHDLKLNILQDIDQMIKDGDEKSLPIQREYILPDARMDFDITIDPSLFKKTKLKIQNIDDIIKAVENATGYLTNLLPRVDHEVDLILGANTDFHQKTIIHALFPDDKERTEVTKALLHSKNGDKIGDHKNDKIAPRVINRVEIEGRLEIAGLAQLIKGEVKNVGKA